MLEFWIGRNTDKYGYYKVRVDQYIASFCEDINIKRKVIAIKTFDDIYS